MHTKAPDGFNPSTGLLIDTNLLVLFVVGSVNRNRIETFKRTSQYKKKDYDLLLRVLSRVSQLYTVAHVLAEVSNPTDLPGPDRHRARQFLKETVSRLQEVVIPSIQAAQGAIYGKLGLVDAAIVEVALQHRCAVLTDDWGLYQWLNHNGLPATKFSSSA